MAPKTPDDASRRNEQQAATLLREADEQITRYPDSTGEILLETIGELRRLGRHEDILELAERLIQESPFDAGYGYFERIESLFALGADAKAEAELTELWEHDAESQQAGMMIAELMESQGEARRALLWADRPFADVLGPGGGPERFNEVEDLMSANGRADIRRRLGLAPDALDEYAARNDPFNPLMHALDAFGDGGALNRARAALGIDGPAPRVGREAAGIISHIVREDVVAAHAAGVLVGFDSDTELTPETYFRRSELGRREVRRDFGFTRADDVPMTLAEIRAYAQEHGLDVTAEETRVAAVEEKHARGGPFPVWPPERNQSCWCGSDRKYKKCCGRP